MAQAQLLLAAQSLSAMAQAQPLVAAQLAEVSPRQRVG